MKDTNKTLGCLAVLLLIPVSMVLKGFVMCELWKWFIIPQFHAAALSIPVALGLTTIAALFTPPPSTSAAEGSGFAASLIYGVITALGLPLSILALGYFIHLFV